LAKRDERSASWQVKCILAPGYVLSICSRVLTASYCPRKREPGPADPLRIGRASGEHRASSRFRLIGRPGRLSRRPADRRPGPPTQLSAPSRKDKSLKPPAEQSGRWPYAPPLWPWAPIERIAASPKSCGEAVKNLRRCLRPAALGREWSAHAGPSWAAPQVFRVQESSAESFVTSGNRSR
jgi:hypothetical protein